MNKYLIDIQECQNSIPKYEDKMKIYNLLKIENRDILIVNPFGKKYLILSDKNDRI